MKDNCYVSAGISVKHPKVPLTKQYIRYVESNVTKNVQTVQETV